MVHALEQVHRLLKPGGVLVDIHPVAEAPLVEVHQGETVLFAEPFPGFSAEDYQRAQDALASAVKRGLFARERGGQFDFLVYASSFPELRDYVEEQGAFDETPADEAQLALDEAFYTQIEAAMRLAGAGALVATHERVRIARLRPVK
jgi:hypothetical protein